MTNREYLNNKKKSFYSKIEDFLLKYVKIISWILSLSNIASIVCTFKIHIGFLALAVPLTILNIVIIYGLIFVWLECERKEKE